MPCTALEILIDMFFLQLDTVTSTRRKAAKLVLTKLGFLFHFLTEDKIQLFYNWTPTTLLSATDSLTKPYVIQSDFS